MKVIYLDQFVLKRAFCPSPQDKHKEFFGRLGKLCMRLANQRVASFPFSESHVRETALLDNGQRDTIAIRFKCISNGYQFVSALGVQTTQAMDLRKGLPLDLSPHRVVFKNDMLDFGWKLSMTDVRDRKKEDETIREIFTRWDGVPKRMLHTIAEEESGTWPRLLTQELARMSAGVQPDLYSLVFSPVVRPFLDLQSEAMAEGVEDPVLDTLSFVVNHAKDVHCVRLASELWHAFAKVRHGNIKKATRSIAEDVQFISSFVPYCDAAFVDKEMGECLKQCKLLAGCETKVFSLRDGRAGRAEFLDYLSGLEKDHVIAVSPKSFPTCETERLLDLRQHGPLLWICFIPTHPEELVRSKVLNVQAAPGTLIECRILPGGGIEWVEAIPDMTSISSDQLEGLIRQALERMFVIPREGSHTLMRINYSLANCSGMEIEHGPAFRPKRIRNNLLRLGVSDWFTDGPGLLSPKLGEILDAIFQSKSAKRGIKGRRVSAAPTGLG